MAGFSDLFGDPWASGFSVIRIPWNTPGMVLGDVFCFGAKWTKPTSTIF